MLVSHMHMCCICKEVASFRGGLGQLIDNRTLAWALQTIRKKAACSLHRNWN